MPAALSPSCPGLGLGTGPKLLAAPSRLLERSGGVMPGGAAQQRQARSADPVLSEPPGLLSGPLCCWPAAIPLLASGIGRLLLQQIHQSSFRFHPAPASLQLAFARIGQACRTRSWISLHGREPEPLAAGLQAAASRPGGAHRSGPGRCRGGCARISCGLPAWKAPIAVWLCERLGHPDERRHGACAAEAPFPAGSRPAAIGLVLIAETPAPPDPGDCRCSPRRHGLWLAAPPIRPGPFDEPNGSASSAVGRSGVPPDGVLWDLGRRGAARSVWRPGALRPKPVGSGRWSGAAGPRPDHRQCQRTGACIRQGVLGGEALEAGGSRG